MSNEDWDEARDRIKASGRPKTVPVDHRALLLELYAKIDQSLSADDFVNQSRSSEPCDETYFELERFEPRDRQAPD